MLLSAILMGAGIPKMLFEEVIKQYKQKKSYFEKKKFETCEKYFSADIYDLKNKGKMKQEKIFKLV